MTRARLKKYDNGRARKVRHREKADRLLLECGVRDYGAVGETGNGGGAAVMTVSADHRLQQNGRRDPGQMLLWDQPVTIATAEKVAAPAPEVPVREPIEPEQVAEPSVELSAPKLPTPKVTPAAALPSWVQRSPAPRPSDFTWPGFIKGCGIGVAAAAALLLIYALIS
ncbi:MAG: hypothetical protein GY842_02590 [bacterium]|nr:hypothetical protein [bacterium]